MPKFLIEYSLDDGVHSDVVEAESEKHAELEAEERSFQHWQTYKIHTAKPFEDADGQARDDTLSRRGVLHHSDAVRSDAGGNGAVKP